MRLLVAILVALCFARVKFDTLKLATHDDCDGSEVFQRNEGDVSSEPRSTMTASYERVALWEALPKARGGAGACVAPSRSNAAETKPVTVWGNLEEPKMC